MQPLFARGTLLYWRSGLWHGHPFPQSRPLTSESRGYSPAIASQPGQLHSTCPIIQSGCAFLLNQKDHRPFEKGRPKNKHTRLFLQRRARLPGPECIQDISQLFSDPGKKRSPFWGLDHFSWGHPKKGKRKRVPLNS